MALFASKFFTGIGSFVANITSLKDQASTIMSKVTLRHQLLEVTLGAGGVSVVDLSALGYADFEVLPQVTINGTSLASMKLVTATASGKDITGTNRKITLTGRRIKIVSGATDLLTGLWENAVAGDTVNLLVFEKG